MGPAPPLEGALCSVPTHDECACLAYAADERTRRRVGRTDGDASCRIILYIYYYYYYYYRKENATRLLS